jgi:hypothetical protein
MSKTEISSRFRRQALVLRLWPEYRNGRGIQRRGRRAQGLLSCVLYMEYGTLSHTSTHSNYMWMSSPRSDLFSFVCTRHSLYKPNDPFPQNIINNTLHGILLSALVSFNIQSFEYFQALFDEVSTYAGACAWDRLGRPGQILVRAFYMHFHRNIF